MWPCRRMQKYNAIASRKYFRFLMLETNYLSYTSNIIQCFMQNGVLISDADNEGADQPEIPCTCSVSYYTFNSFTSRKHAYLVLTPLNPTFIQ